MGHSASWFFVYSWINNSIAESLDHDAEMKDALKTGLSSRET
jgi:hypothetical protein